MHELKVVASTRIWESKNPGHPDFPMWHPVGSNEYIIGYLEVEEDTPPTLAQIGEFVGDLQHILEGRITPNIVEIFTGYEVYFKDAHTHNEQFQMNSGGSIDFPAEDITKIEGQD